MLTQNDRLGIGCARCNAPKRVRTARVNSVSAALHGNQGRVTLETLALQVRSTAIAVSPVSSLSLNSSSKTPPPESRAFGETFDALIAGRQHFGARDAVFRACCLRNAATIRSAKVLTSVVRLKENTAGNPAVMK